jgi:hypothetical protein
MKMLLVWPKMKLLTRLMRVLLSMLLRDRLFLWWPMPIGHGQLWVRFGNRSTLIVLPKAEREFVVVCSVKNLRRHRLKHVGHATVDA